MKHSAIFVIVFGSLIVLPARGEHRIFGQRAGDDPNVVPPSGAVIMTGGGAAEIIDVYVEQAPTGTRLGGVQVTMPCSATCSLGGRVDYVIGSADLLTNSGRLDFCYSGRYCDSGPNIGLPCTNAADCPGGDAGPCVGPYCNGSLQLCFPITDDGTCPGAYGPRRAAAADAGYPAIVLVAPCNFGTFQYSVTQDAKGDCVIEIPNEPASASRDQNDMPIPFITSPVTFRIPVGQCCDGLDCIGDEAAGPCQSMGGFWNPNRTCAESCACASEAECDDSNVCTFERCTGGACQGYDVGYGDVNGSGGLVDVDDLLCTINGFADVVNCPNADVFPLCAGDDLVNLDDILRVLAAFGGVDPCGCT